MIVKDKIWCVKLGYPVSVQATTLQPSGYLLEKRERVIVSFFIYFDVRLIWQRLRSI